MLATSSLRSLVSAAEWEQRVNLAAAYRLVAHFELDDLVFTHISARVPGPDHHFLINPYGMFFDEITASNLVTVDLDGNKVMQSPFDINPAGFVIHSAIHSAREDAMCVLHLHTLDGVAVSAQRDGLSRYRSNPCWYCRPWPITTTKGSPSMTTRSQGWCAIWEAAISLFCATTVY